MAGSEANEAAVARALTAVIEEMNEERDEDMQLGTEASALLYGSGGTLDSLDLVRLVVLFEQQLADDVGCAVSISDDRAMSQENSHFHSFGSLVGYALTLIEEEGSGG